MAPNPIGALPHPERATVSSHFNANPYLEAIELPTLTIGERTWTGRNLGAPTWFALQPELERIESGEMSLLDGQRFIRRLTDEIFPAEPRGWQIWRPRAESAGAALCALPFGVQLEALQSFIRCQVSALKPPTLAGQPTPPTLAELQGGSGSGA